MYLDGRLQAWASLRMLSWNLPNVRRNYRCRIARLPSPLRSQCCPRRCGRSVTTSGASATPARKLRSAPPGGRLRSSRVTDAWRFTRTAALSCLAILSKPACAAGWRRVRRPAICCWAIATCAATARRPPRPAAPISGSPRIPAPSDAVHVDLSLVVPVHNEAAGLDEFFSRTIAVLDKLGLTWEIVCVNDGSTDASLDRLLEYHRRNPAIKIVNLSRNFGKDIALSAGLDYARGDAVVPIDADLQDPPELIERMVAKWREGFDMVYAVRNRRDGDSWLKRVTA